MVAAVRCPNAKCRKFMLVEQAEQGKVIPCLICKQPVKVPLTSQTAPLAPAPLPAPTAAPLPVPTAAPLAPPPVAAPLMVAPLAPIPIHGEELPVAEAIDDDDDLSPIFEDEPKFKMD